MLGLAIQASDLVTCCGPASPTKSGTASKLYGTFHDLLRVGSYQPAFLDLSVPILCAIRGALTNVLRQRGNFGSHDKIKQILDLLLASVLDIISETLACSQGSASDGHSATDLLQRSVGVIHGLGDQLLHELWANQLPPDVLASRDAVAHVNRMHDWLKPNDRTARNAYGNLWGARALLTEFTCEWFSKPLLDFVRSSDKAFWVEGPLGSGKSMLHSWIIDRLQNQVGGQDYIVLTFRVDPLLPSEQGETSLLKGLLLESFAKLPGLISLYSTLSEAMSISATSESLSEVTEALWTALRIVLMNISRPAIVAIDGISELSGNDSAASRCLGRLHQFVSESPTTRLVLLSCSFDQLPKLDMRRFAIQRSHLQEDLRRVINEAIALDRPERQRDAIDWIMSRANGNFLWAMLIIQIWRWEFDQSSSAIAKSLPTSLDAMVSSLVSRVDFDDPITRFLLFSSLVAIRPLRVDEAQSLLGVDVSMKGFSKQQIDIPKTIDQGCGSVMLIENGIIQFRHSVFRGSLQQFAETRLGRSSKTIHKEMATRLLLYLQLVVATRSELTLIPVALSVLDEISRSHQLMIYALRYWPWHYEQAGLLNKSKSLAPKDDLRLVFPENNFVAALEARYWTSEPLHDAVQALQFAKQARQEILGDHLATLQSTILLARRYQSAAKFPQATTYFAAAFRLAQRLLPEYHHFTVQCASDCLESVQSAPEDIRIDLPVTIPEILQYLITDSKDQCGSGSDRVLEYHRLLARHYTETKQYGLSTQAHREIYRLTMDRFGKFSPQAKAVAGDFAGLLQQSDQPKDHNQYDDLVYDNAVDSFAVTDSRRIKASITKAEMCKSRNDILNAELEYLHLIHGIIESRESQESEEKLQEAARIGLLYAGFLKEQNRMEKSQAVLLGLWTNLESREHRAPVIRKLLKDLALKIEEVGLPAMALNILIDIAAWPVVGDPEFDDLGEIDETISYLTSELTSGIESELVLPKATEDVFMQTLESASSQGSRIDSDSLICVTQALTSSLCFEKRWQDVLYVTSTALHLLWPAVLNCSGEQLPSNDLDPRYGEIAMSLAKAHDMLGTKDTAGSLYWYVLSSAKASGFKESGFFARIAQAAVAIFEQTGQFKKLIDAMQELVAYNQAILGETHTETVDSSYALASLCMEYGELDVAKKVYERIATNLQLSDYHDRRALPSLQALLVIFRGKKQWEQAAKVYHSLWRTFLEKGRDYRIREDTAGTLFKEYSQLLENHIHADSNAIHQVREEYRRGCVASFGEQSLITLEAVVDLAKSWEQKETDSAEAIHLYESIIDKQGDRALSAEDDTAELLDQVEAALRYYYCSHLEDLMDMPTLRRAILLQNKQYLKDKTSSNPTSPQSLSDLVYLVSLLTKEGSSRSRDTAVQNLEQTFDAIVLSDCEGKALVDAATVLASAFIEGNFIDEGLNSIQSLREQLIFREKSDSNLHDTERLGLRRRSRLPFLTAFETRMRGSMDGFAEIHSRSLLEVALWDSFEALKSSTTAREQVLARGANLQALLMNHYPSYKGENLQQQLCDLFMEVYHSAFSTGAQAPRKFITVILKALSAERSEIDIPHLACVAVKQETERLAKQQEFSELLEIAAPGFDFLRYVGAFGRNYDFGYGFHLGLILGDIGPLSSDQVVCKQMLELSKLILREALQLCRTKELDIDSVSIDELSRVADVLGKHQNYYDLEVSAQAD